MSSDPPGASSWGWSDGKPAKVDRNEERVTLVVRVRAVRARSSPLAPEALVEQLQEHHAGTVVAASSRTPQPDGSVEVRYEQVPVGWYDLLVTETHPDSGRVVGEATQRLQLVRLQETNGQEEPHRLTLELSEADSGFVFLSPERWRIAHARYRIQSEGTTWQGEANAKGRVDLEPPPRPGSKALVQWSHPATPLEREFDYTQEVYVDIKPEAATEQLKQRLHNWGYEPDNDLGRALRAYQRDSQLAETGEADERTSQRSLYDQLGSRYPRRG